MKKNITFANAQKNIFILLIILYTPILAISNIVGVKINYLIAGFIITASLIHCIKKRRVFIIILCYAILFILRFIILGNYGLKENIIFICGPLIFITFFDYYENTSVPIKKVFLKITIILSILLIIIIIGQFSNIIPNMTGKMALMNKAGYNIIGDFVQIERPSAFLYHSYDTALGLIPIITFLFYKICNKKILLFITYICSLLLAYIINLKILFIYLSILFILTLLSKNKILNYKFLILTSLLMFAVTISFSFINFDQEIIGYSSGRLYIWNLMLNHFINDINFIFIFLGYNIDILSNNLYWRLDESYSTHNQYLNIIIYSGISFFAIFIHNFFLIFKKTKILNNFIFAMIISFAFTGDLFLFTSFWTCLCLTYLLISNSNNTLINKSP